MYPVRIPLSSQPGNSSLRKAKSIRRKGTFARNSSDTIPSSHSSITDAEYLSGSDEIGRRLESWISINASETSHSGIHQDENSKHPLIIPRIGMTPILYGNGTQLATIIEQKSSTTMETKPSKSSLSIYLSRPSSTSALSQLSNTIGSKTPTFLTAQHSFDSSDSLLHPERISRRQKSYSADDLALLKRRKSYQDTCAMIEQITQKRMPVHKMYADPQAPLIPPIKRPTTPPGVPSWNEGQRSNMLPSPTLNEGHSSRQMQHVSFKVSLRNELSLFWNKSKNISGQHRECSIRPESHHSASRPVPIRKPPRFRPIRSGHGIGPLHSHPFFIDPPTPAKVDNPVIHANARIFSHYNNTNTANMLSTGHTGSQGVMQMRVDASHRTKLSPRAPQTPSFTVPASNHPSFSMIRLDAACRPKQKCSHSKGRNILVTDARRALPSKVQWRNFLRCRHRVVSDPMQHPITPSCLDAQESGNSIRVIDYYRVQESPAATTTVQHLDYEPFMSGGGLDDMYADQNRLCWRCHFRNLNNNMNRAWDGSTGWLRWFCCGIEMNDMDNMESPDLIAPRRVVIEGGVF